MTWGAIAGAVIGVTGAAIQNRNARRAQEQQNRTAEQAAATADPGAPLRPYFQDQLLAKWPMLSGVNFAQILQDPSFKFLEEQGTTAATNAASAMGLGRSGTLLEDLQDRAMGRASTFIDSQFGRHMQLLNFLGMSSGLTTGSPGAAGNILLSGGQFGANMDVNNMNNTLGQLGGIWSRYGNNIVNNLGWGSNPPTGGGVSGGGP